MNWQKTAVRFAAIGGGLFLLSVLSGYIAMSLTLERGKIEVPIVVGLELKEAARQLREMGLQPRLAGEEYHPAFPKGAVVRQTPAGGNRLRKNGEVRLIISKGSDETLAPELVGQPITQAQRLLAEHGLLLGPTAKAHAALPAGVVIAQDPPAGFPSRRGSTVSVLVSLGEEERFYVMPNLVGQREEEAVTLLKEMGLEARVSYESFPGQDRRVVQQDPSFGTRIKEREQVTLVIAQ